MNNQLKKVLSCMISLLLAFNSVQTPVKAEEEIATEEETVEEVQEVIEETQEEMTEVTEESEVTVEETVPEEQETPEGESAEETEDAVYAEEAPQDTEDSEAFDTSGDYEYTVNNEQITITKYTGSDTVLTVPAQIEGMQVTVINSKAFSGCSDLIKVELPEGLTTIYAYAFENCTSLEEIKLPDSITTMGYMVFRNDTALTTVNYPKNYTTSINEHGASSGQRGSLFSGCTSLETVSIPEGTETIASYVFQNSSITHIEIP
ncbi:MAG TPA: hypothetical protein DCG51_08140, partial [Erysipelotrichaceae bacterium]|nr:hypothetical protein [Erysipelotrichaceae bacterium]